MLIVGLDEVHELDIGRISLQLVSEDVCDECDFAGGERKRPRSIDLRDEPFLDIRVPPLFPLLPERRSPARPREPLWRRTTGEDGRRSTRSSHREEDLQLGEKGRLTLHSFHIHRTRTFDQIALTHLNASDIGNVTRSENRKLGSRQNQFLTAFVHQVVTILMRGPTSIKRSLGDSVSKKVLQPNPC